MRKITGAHGNTQSSKQNGANARATIPATTPKATSRPAAREEALLKKAGFVEAGSNNSFTVFVRRVHDSSTRIVEFVFVAVYRDGHICPPQYYKNTQLNNKMQTDLINMDGFTDELKDEVCEFMVKNKDKLPSDTLSNGKLPIQEAYQALIDYAKDCGTKDEVHIKDGYISISRALLEDAVKELDMGYTCLELKRALKVMGLLRSNAKSTGHIYDYKIGQYWFLSIKII